jgi:magnesium transporter
MPLLSIAIDGQRSTSAPEPYMEVGFWQMIKKRGGWLCVLFLSEMLTASAMQGYEGELEKAIVLTLFIPLIMSSGGNSGSQATSLTVGATLVGIVMFGSLTGSMLPFALQRIGFDPASASAPFVATLVDVTGLVIYFTVASLILRGTLL